MLSYGARSPIDQIDSPPDTVQTLLLASSVAQAMDWVGASTALRPNLCRVTAVTTAGALNSVNVNLETTYADNPSSGLTTGSTQVSHAVIGTRMFQIPGGSTGFSAEGLSSGYVMFELWKK